jgi:hypothetical protein
MPENEINIEQERTVQGKTVISINKPSPMWATWIFRIVFLLTGVATFIIAADPEISNQLKVRIGIYLKGLDMVVWGLTRMIGVDISRDFNVPK